MIDTHAGTVATSVIRLVVYLDESSRCEYQNHRVR